MLVDKIINGRHPSKIDKDSRRHSSSVPSHTKNLNKRLSDQGGARGSGQDRPESLKRATGDVLPMAVTKATIE
jgi:hypothetical protein